MTCPREPGADDAMVDARTARVDAAILFLVEDRAVKGLQAQGKWGRWGEVSLARVKGDASKSVHERVALMCAIGSVPIPSPDDWARARAAAASESPSPRTTVAAAIVEQRAACAAEGPSAADDADPWSNYPPGTPAPINAHADPGDPTRCWPSGGPVASDAPPPDQNLAAPARNDWHNHRQRRAKPERIRRDTDSVQDNAWWTEQ